MDYKMIDIKRLKAELGLTQAELGAIMGLRQPQVSTILLGKGKLREEHILKLQQALGDKINIYLNENTGATQKDNTITNSTKTQEMDPLTMDYINTLKEQLATKDEQIKALLRQLDSKGADEVLSRRLGAVEERQDELTNKP